MNGYHVRSRTFYKARIQGNQATCKECAKILPRPGTERVPETSNVVVGVGPRRSVDAHSSGGGGPVREAKGGDEEAVERQQTGGPETRGAPALPPFLPLNRVTVQNRTNSKDDMENFLTPSFLNSIQVCLK